MSWGFLGKIGGAIRDNVGSVVKVVATGAFGMPGVGGIVGSLVSKAGEYLGGIGGQGQAASDNAMAAAGAIADQAVNEARRAPDAAAADRAAAGMPKPLPTWVLPGALAVGAAGVVKLLSANGRGNNRRGRGSRRGGSF